MAIDPNTVWEFEPGGSDNNGGGYINGGGGTDYSTSTASILSLSDATQILASNTLTTVLGIFTSAMSGNTIFIRSGVNFVTGFYQIVNFTNSANVVLDRTATSGGAGLTGTGEVGGCRKNIDQNVFPTTIVAGNTAYVQLGTMTLATSFGSSNGSAASPITWVGYNISRGDNPTDTSRPLINYGANTFTFGTRHVLQYLQFTGTQAGGIQGATETRYKFCKFISTSTGATTTAALSNGVSTAANTQYLGCEFSASNSIGLGETSNSPSSVTGCTFSNCKIGYQAKGTGSMLAFSIFKGCTTSSLDCATLGASTVMKCINNTFYGAETPSGIGVNVSTAASTDDFLFVNNIIYGFTTGVLGAASRNSAFIAYNNYFNNTTARVNFAIGLADLALNPNFISATSGNFAIGTNLKATAFPGVFPGGLSTGFLDIGSVQRQEPASGGTTTTNIFIIDD